MVRRRTVLRSICVGGVAVLAGCGASNDLQPDPSETTDDDAGTRVEAPLVGSHVTGLETAGVDWVTAGGRVAEELDVRRTDIRVRSASGTVETYDGTVGTDEFAAALQQAGFDTTAEDVQRGVTAATREAVVATLRDRIDSSDLSDGEVTQTEAGLIAVELPNTDTEAATEFLTDERDVYIVAEVRNSESETTTTTTVLDGSDIETVGSVRQRPGGSAYSIPVTVEDGAAERFRDTLVELGITEEPGLRNCDRTDNGDEMSGSYCLLTEVDGQVVHSNAMGPDLGAMMRDGDWRDAPSFTIGTPNEPKAQTVRKGLQRGVLPTELDLEAARITRTDS